MLEATDIQSENKVDKLNVNKHLFCIKKAKIYNIFTRWVQVLSFYNQLFINSKHMVYGTAETYWRDNFVFLFFL